MISLSSNIPGDLKIYTNSLSDNHGISRLAFKPKSILETFSECKLQGKFLFSKVLAEHVNYKITGALPVVFGGELQIVTQNCVGDIFRSYLSVDEGEGPGKVFDNSMIKVMTEWNEKLEQNEQRCDVKPIKVDNIVMMRGVKRILCGSQKGGNEEDIDVELGKITPAWQLNVPDYYSYKDSLAADLLSVN